METNSQLTRKLSASLKNKMDLEKAQVSFDTYAYLYRGDMR